MTAGVLVMQVVNAYDVVGPEVARVLDRRNAKAIVTTYRQALMMAGPCLTSRSCGGFIRDFIQGVRPTVISLNRVL